ncbi:MAG TPA: sugar phosphate isomerase/epimerase, partial [Bryobacteraceae bacterium]|nr:sugar phosphate isomerase/epimerase [Bryobacteraceae bacterium]
QWLASSLPLLAAAPLAFAKTSRTLGVQVYTVRSILMKESERVIKAIADIGYKEIEGAGRADLMTLMPIIKQNGLRAVSCHVETPLITGDWEHAPGMKKADIGEAIEQLKAAGIQYLTMAYIAPNMRGTDLDFYKKTADQMNKAAELCHKAGLQFAYHNHAFEFGGKPGERPIDIFKERLDKKLVALEMDVFWVSVAGHDPVGMLKEWKGRVSLLHLKDKAKDVPVQYKEGLPPASFKEVGNGSLDFAAILKAAPAAGVKHYFVEQDQTPGDPIESLKKSFDYVSKL